MDSQTSSVTPAASGSSQARRSLASRNGRPTASGETTPILAAADLELANTISRQLSRVVGCAVAIRSFDEVRAEAPCQRDGLVLLQASTPQEAQLARQVVQEVALQKLSYILVWLTVEESAAELTQEIAPYVKHLLYWPRDAAQLAHIVRNRPLRRRGYPLGGFPEGSLEDRMARRLLAFTPSLMPMVERLALAASHDVTVLLTGETGTGKTFLARLIHELSPRCQERFLIVPCGALAPNLIESELFGHVKGAFTGADRPKIGKFAAAGKGTLLLDEVDALPLEQQANLLRVVETGEFEPVGSTETHKAQCRLIVASNRNLKEEADRGRFRQDLYFRFNVMSFHLPPLRERIEDIAPLVRGFAARFTSKFHKDLFDVSPEAMGVLESYPWPGNLRELENAIQHAVLVSQGPVLELRHLPEAIQEQSLQQSAGNKGAADTLLHNRELLERSVIQRALANNGGSRSRAAHELGISRVTLYKKMKKYGLLEGNGRQGRRYS